MRMIGCGQVFKCITKIEAVTGYKSNGRPTNHLSISEKIGITTKVVTTAINYVRLALPLRKQTSISG